MIDHLQEESLYVCLDCGGSKTACSISNAAGKIVARATGGPSNFADAGAEGFVSAVKLATQKALALLYTDRTVTLPSESGGYFKAAWIGASGIDREEDANRLLDPISKLLSIPVGPRLRVMNDTALLASPLRDFPEADTAVVVIAGTGSRVAAIQEDHASGKLKEVGQEGGLGWILGDEGSGIHVGKETIRWILDRKNRMDGEEEQKRSEAEKEADDAFQQAVLEHYKVPTTSDLLYLVYAEDPSKHSELDQPTQSSPWLRVSKKTRISSVTPIVFDFAFTHGSMTALSILSRTSHGSATQVREVLRSARLDSPRAVLCFGGSLVGVDAYRKMIMEDLKAGGHVFAGAAFVKDAGDSGAERLAVLMRS